MINFFKLFLSTIILLSISFSPWGTIFTQPQNDQPTIALVSRIVEIVERRTPEIDWKKALIGDLLNSGDIVRTGDESFALIRFYDNSLVRVRERSQLIVHAKRDETGYHRNLQLDEGSVTFDVRKREQDRFEFSTPTSVASVRGTSGAFLTVPDDRDVIAILTGFIILLNRISMLEQIVGENQYAFSDTEGNIIIGDLGDLPEDLIEMLGLLDEQNGIQPRQQEEIEFELQNNEGNTIRLKLLIEVDEI